MEVVGQGVQQEIGLLLDITIRAQNQEDVETEPLEEDGVEVVLAPDHHCRDGGDGVLVVVLVVEFAEASHLLLDPFVLNKLWPTDLEM